MKKLTAFCVLALLAFAVNAQYDENFTFWNTALNPDNGNAKTIKKEGLKTLTVLAYEPDADDTAATVTHQGAAKFDENGRIAFLYAAGNKSDEPTFGYNYDKKGKVTKFSYPLSANQKQTFEFEYDKKKGFKSIKHTDSNLYTYNMEKSLLKAISGGDTMYFYFNKNGMPEKYAHAYGQREKNPGRNYSDTTYYTYDKKGNLIAYSAITLNKFGDTVSYETGAYTYNKKKALTAASIKKYSMEKSRTMPATEENHTFAISAKSGRLVNHSKTVKQNYYKDGEMHTDTHFIDAIYTYSANGLEVSKSVSNNPGVVLLYEYRYSK